MNRVIIIHGWEGNPSINWFPWLKSELEAKGIKVEVPEMPNTAHPTQDIWVNHLSKIIGTPDKETFLIGHSLGGITILRYLETLSSNQQVGGIILTASFPESLGYQELDSFFQKQVDYKKIRETVSGEIIAIQSDNDKYVPFKNGELLRDNLNAKLITIHNGGHLNGEDGYFQLPEVLDELTKMMNL